MQNVVCSEDKKLISVSFLSPVHRSTLSVERTEMSNEEIRWEKPFMGVMKGFSLYMWSIF